MYTISSDKEISIITVNLQRATMTEAGEFKDVFIKEIKKGSKQIIVDMNECEYIDSTFLGVLVLALKTANEAGGEIILVGFKSTARSVIDITGTSRVFKIHTSVKQAVSNLRAAV